ncbi:LysR family transcriptional regulator [Caballeronia sp. dw_19]|uniref:LysR family transcriptional regulator n=1 Tax=Caballeronia sp. dw_19 TaxID=2719791 RepID=UPI001BD18799|nr:LysR family transcriptional regulator [Caballeronia sp. dw_19]
MLPKMDLNLLRVFDVVMAERNVTKAAGLLHMTQPAVSNALARLRHVLHDELFLKSPHGVTPTAKAEMIWPTITESLRQMHMVLDPDEFDPATANLSFRLAMSDYLVSQIIRPLIAVVERAAPNISLHIRPHHLENVNALLEHGEIDVAAGVFPFISPASRFAALHKLNYVCAMRKDHPLARETLTIERFLDARHLCISLAGGTTMIDRQLSELGHARKIVLTVNQFTVVPAILKDTDLICILPPATISDTPYKDAIALLPPPVEIRPQPVQMLWHSRNDPLASHAWLRRMIVESAIPALALNK